MLQPLAFLRRALSPPPVPEDVRTDVQNYLARHHGLVDGWFFSTRLAFAIGLLGYLVVDAFTSGQPQGWGLFLVGSYFLANVGTRLMGGRTFPHARWCYAALDLTFLAVLRHAFLFEALVDPNATLTGLLTLLLVGYASYSDPRLSSGLALAAIFLLLGTFASDAWIAGQTTPGELGDAARRFYSLPLRALLLVMFLSVAALLTSGLAYQLRHHFVAHTTEVRRRAYAAVAVQTERERRTRLEELNRLKEGFLSVLAHELRTPLAPLASSLELLAEEVDEASPARPLVDVAQAAGDRLARLVQDYTRLAELVAYDRQPLERAAFRADALARLALAGSPGVVTDGLDPVVAYSDPRLVGGALLAVLRRAVLVSAGGPPPTLHVAAENGAVRIAVTDATSHVPDADADTLADLFGETRERTFSAGSTGIELTLAHLALRRLDGRLTVESTPGRGTVVTFHLPCADAADAAPLDEDALRFALASSGLG